MSEDLEKQLSRTFSADSGVDYDKPPTKIPYQNQNGKGLQFARTVTVGGSNLPQALTLTRTQTHAHIPIGYRTLSIQVYDSQRWDDAPKRRPKSQWQWPWRNKATAAGSEIDADFFGKLDYHLVSTNEVCQRFNTSPTLGLDSKSAAKRLERNGRNVLQERNPQWAKRIFGWLFGDFCSILWIGVIIFMISWKPLGSMDGGTPAPYNLALAVVVILVILSQAGFTAFSDWSAAKVMQSIAGLMPENSVVLRDGQNKTVPTSEVVVGDVVLLSTGNRVPADMRIIKASNDLKFDKSIVTGESEEVPGTVDSDEKSFLEARNIALLGTHVCNGTATGVVTMIGSRTLMGTINKLTNNAGDERTQLQREITRFVWIIISLTLSLIMMMVIFYLAYIRTHQPDYLNVPEFLTDLMSLVVAFIPEGMPMAVAVTLSQVAKRMRDAKVLPKSLSTVETLGSVNVICSDKTGTLTTNQMSVVSLGYVDAEFVPREAKVDSEAFTIFKRGMILCNDAFFDQTPNDHPEAEKVVQGNATDAALLRLTATLPGGRDAIVNNYTRVFDMPFNSKVKFALTYVEATGEKPLDEPHIIIKGAPDILMPKCDSYLSENGSEKPLDKEARARLVAMQEAWSRKGERVILLAQKQYTRAVSSADPEAEFLEETADGLTVIGLVGIVDPPRQDIPFTVSECRRAGSRFFMVTGDFSLTAVAIAQNIGLLSSKADPDHVADFEVKGRFAQLEEVRDDRLAHIPAGLVIEGKEIPALNTEQWDVICKYEEIVFARTTPEQKLRIVQELRDRDNCVAVTGDGVNDAPALKAANIGIAMAAGSEVAMEAADLVLLGDFSSIVEGIKLGRLVFVNLQKVISYLLPAGSYSEDWPVILNVFLGVPLPLNSFLMIIICCFTDLACCLGLVFEQAEFDLLSLAPRDPKREHLVNMKIYLQSYLFIGTMETVVAHSMFFYYMWETTGIPLSGMFLAFENFADGYYGNSIDELNNALAVGQSVYFVTLILLQWGNLLSVRNKRMSIFQNSPFNNPRLFIGPFVALVVAIFVTEVPGIQSLFGTASVPIKFWFIPLPIALGILVADETRKLLVRSFPKSIIARVAW